MAGFYTGDSFFNLPGWAQGGLVLLSVLMTGGLLAALGVGARRLPGQGRGRIIGRVLLAALGYIAFLWLSPQVYYLYYQAVFPGLPWQVVIGWPAPAAALRLMAFAGPETLADHARGVLGCGLALWAMLPALRCRR